MSFTLYLNCNNTSLQCLCIENYVVHESYQNAVILLLVSCSTDRPPCNPLHDEVLASLQVFDNIFAQSGVGLDEALDYFVEVKGGEVDHVQYPRETHICFGCVTTTMVVSSSLKTAL